MSGPSVALSPFVPVSIEEAVAYLSNESIRLEGHENRVRSALNAAIAEFEHRTSRGLMARTYRTAETAVVSVAANAMVGTGSGFDSVVETWDVILSSGLPEGCQVLERTATSLTLSRPAATAVVSETMTFGSAPVRISGIGDRHLYLPDHPVIEVFSAAVVSADGSEDALDVTSWVELGDTGVVYLPNDIVPRGTRNVSVEYSAGYRPRTASGHGDTAAIDRLKRGVLRLAQVLLSDEMNASGRAVSKSLLREGFQIGDFSMPADIMSCIHSFTDVV